MTTCFTIIKPNKVSAYHTPKKAIEKSNPYAAKKEQELITLKSGLTFSKRDSLLSTSLLNSDSPNCDFKISWQLWKSMSRGSKHDELAKGSNLNIRKALGLNLSNTINKNVDAESPLRKEICLLFDRDDVSRISLDVKKLVSNPDNQIKKVLAYLRLSTLKVLHAKSEAESDIACSY